MNNKKVLLGHGSGGKLTQELINSVFVKYFDNPFLNKLTDSALCSFNGDKLAFTTDSYVINPIFFPGGNIGKLAVCGTVNDLAVSGAKPLYLSSSFIIEEGLELEVLDKIVQSMANEAKNNDVMIVTGDTKVVARGECDKIFINTAGIGVITDKYKNNNLSAKIAVGDKIIINGTLGDHGMAIMAARNELNIETKIISDCASLKNLIKKAMDVTSKIKYMQDITRGGLATILNEVAFKNKIGIKILESLIPVTDVVRGLCELLGFDPLYVANEGKIMLIVGKNDAENVLNEIKKDELGKNASIIGEIVDGHKGKVIMGTEVGGERIIDSLSGMQLPRIC